MKEKKQQGKAKTYHKHLTLVIVIVTLTPCIILCGICLKLLYPQWFHSSLEKHYNTVEYTSLSVSEQLGEMLSKMQYILYDTGIRPYINQADQLSLTFQLELLEKMDETAASLTVDNSALSIRWYPYTTTKSYGSNCFPLDILAEEFDTQGHTEEFQRIQSLPESKFYWTVRHISRRVNNTGAPEDRLCLYAQFSASNTPSCVLELSIPLVQLYDSGDYETIPDSLFLFCQNSGTQDWYIPLNTTLTEEQTRIHLNDYLSLGKTAGYHIIQSSVPNVANGEIVYFLPNSYVRINLLPYVLAFAGIALLVAALIITTSYLTARLLTGRVIYFIDEINDNLDAYFSQSEQPAYSADGIAQISGRIQQLIQNTQQYYSQLKYYETENLRMELELLQMRFNPHLLYNTLGTLKIHIQDPMFQNTIDSLCSYYSIILNNGHLLIKIKDELEMIKEYLFIQKSAYGLTDIEYVFDFDERVNNYSVIKHILQPIVENAINHGLKPAKRPGLLTVTAALEEGDVVIHVTDNGRGISPKTIDGLLKQPKSSRFSGGYGIYNVQQRIQLYYGEEYGLKIESVMDRGTSVQVRIPARVEDEITLPDTTIF